MWRLSNFSLSLFVIGIVLRCAESQEITASTLTASLAENSAVGTTVTTLAVSGFTNTPTLSLGGQTAVTGSPWFELVGNDVKVISGASVNFEDSALVAASSVYEVVVKAEEATATQSVTSTLTITITDVAPTLTAGLTANLDENSGDGTTITTVGPVANGVTFTLGTISPNHDYFEIADAATGAMTVKSGATIDYEAAALTTKKHEIEVIAAETGDTSVTATATITIVDVAPTLTVGLTASLNENSVGGTAVTTVGPVANGVTFTLGTISPNHDYFEIADAATGAMTVKSGVTIDYEAAALTTKKYEIQIIAAETGDTSVTATATITIVDVAPTLNTGLTANLDENSAAGAAVTTVGPAAAGVIFTIASITPNDDYFKIGTATTGDVIVKTGATIDYEASGFTTKEYEIKIIATDSASETTTATATITILDIPEFNAGTLTKDQPENTAAEASITTVTTTTTSATFTILAQAPDHGMFAISTAGLVSVAPNKVLDYENSDVVSASREYKITVKQDSPDFTSGLTATLEENTEAATDVSTIVTDPVDAVLATGTQTGNLGWFEVSSSTRKVTIAADKVVDYENAELTDHKYTMIITASASGGNTGTATLTVTITDVAESAATVLTGSVMAALFLLLSLRLI